jgi:starch phosphorylase
VSEQGAIAYFSMEIALDPAMPTYAGGLGVLAGDTIRSCADLGLPLVGVTLLHRRGYFHQRLDDRGQQTEEPVDWEVEDFVEAAAPRVTVTLEERPVQIRAWRYRVKGVGGAEVPVYLLDTDLPENAPDDRRLTDSLYGGDPRYRLLQEGLLGIGGVRMLRALGHARIGRFHLNEGHAALAVLALVEERLSDEQPSSRDLAAAVKEIRQQCVFTTHTPVPAGHDRFPRALALSVLGEERVRWLTEIGKRRSLNMTDLALRTSHFVNGVAMRHREVSRSLHPGYPIRSITNGIHPATWAAPPFRRLFDRHLDDWRRDALSLRYAVAIPTEEIWSAHALAKQALVQAVNAATNADFRADTLTIGFARRATAYKRAALVFHDLERLASIAKRLGPFQLVFAGKAHPADAEGKALVRRVFEARDALRGRVAVSYLPNYDMELGGLLCAGSDVWLNTPVPPLEASGTSGMKAALNGVPSLSVLDGWWVEGHVEGVTGWAIGSEGFSASVPAAELDSAHAKALYAKLETEVLPRFYGHRERYLQMMRATIALNASFFNSQRMVLQYLYDAYLERSRGS